MHPARFEYLGPSTLEDAIVTLAERGDEAEVVACGQSLIPLMTLRSAAPSIVIYRAPHSRDYPDGVSRHPACEEVRCAR